MCISVHTNVFIFGNFGIKKIRQDSVGHNSKKANINFKDNEFKLHVVNV